MDEEQIDAEKTWSSINHSMLSVSGFIFHLIRTRTLTIYIYTKTLKKCPSFLKVILLKTS
jgi:hypothetical protein